MGPNNLIEKIKDKFKKDFQNSIEEEDFEDIIDAVHKNGIIESEEKEMINNVLDFSEMCVKDVMTPYANICFLNIDSTYKEILELYQKEMYTRIPVYKENNDNIIGILNIKDLILYDKKKRFKIEDFLREPYYTYELKNTKELMKEMREKYEWYCFLDEVINTIHPKNIVVYGTLSSKMFDDFKKSTNIVCYPSWISDRWRRVKNGD